MTGHEGPTRAGTPKNTFVLGLGPAVMSTITLTMMFLEDNFISAVLDFGTEKVLHNAAQPRLHHGAREPYPADDLSTKKNVLVSYCEGLSFFAVLCLPNVCQPLGYAQS